MHDIEIYQCTTWVNSWHSNVTRNHTLTRRRVYLVVCSACKEINDSRILLEYLKYLLVKNIFSTINLRISTYLSLYNNFTLSHIHNSLYLICRTLRAHNFNRSQKKVTIRRYSKKILCSLRRIIIATSRWRLFLKICKKMRSCRMIWINRIIRDESK
jgi:hypothetical protein